MTWQARLKRGLLNGTTAAALVLAAVGALYLSYRFAGLVDTIVYAVLFLSTALFIPTLIVLKVPTMLQSLKRIFGRSHFVLGQLAYGCAFLVQRRAGWDLCRGRRVDPYVIEVDGNEYTVAYAVSIDGVWEPVIGTGNVSVLGWRPFGILREKGDDTYRDIRVDDPRAADDIDAPALDTIATGDIEEFAFVENGADGEEIGSDRTVEYRATGDDGEEIVTKTVSEAPLTADDVPESGYLVDLKELYARGVEQIGDVKLIEKVEEVTLRNDVKDGAFSTSPLVGSIVGLILGVIVGIIVLQVPVF